MTVVAIIVAGGTGQRFGAEAGKQLAPVAGRPLLAWTVDAFDACDAIDEIVVVTDPARVAEYAEAVASDKLAAVVAGGETRQDSVAAGLAELGAQAELVAVHDGARPLVTAPTIASAIDALRESADLGGVVVGHPVFDTLKRTAEDGRVLATVDRSDLWAAQTPQVFRVPALRDAYSRAAAEGFTGTDDAGLVERYGGEVRMVPGPRENLKVTVAEDLGVVEAVLRTRGA